MLRTWLIIFSASVAAAVVILGFQFGAKELGPDKERDYRNVYLYTHDTHDLFMYSLKGSGPITGTYVRSMEAAQIERNGVHCYEIDALPAGDGVWPALSWEEADGTMQSASKPNGITAYVCDGHMLGGLI